MSLPGAQKQRGEKKDEKVGKKKRGAQLQVITAAA